MSIDQENVPVPSNQAVEEPSIKKLKRAMTMFEPQEDHVAEQVEVASAEDCVQSVPELQTSDNIEEVVEDEFPGVAEGIAGDVDGENENPAVEDAGDDSEVSREEVAGGAESPLGVGDSIEDEAQEDDGQDDQGEEEDDDIYEIESIPGLNGEELSEPDAPESPAKEGLAENVPDVADGELRTVVKE